MTECLHFSERTLDGVFGAVVAYNGVGELQAGTTWRGRPFSRDNWDGTNSRRPRHRPHAPSAGIPLPAMYEVQGGMSICGQNGGIFMPPTVCLSHEKCTAHVIDRGIPVIGTVRSTGPTRRGGHRSFCGYCRGLQKNQAEVVPADKSRRGYRTRGLRTPHAEVGLA